MTVAPMSFSSPTAAKEAYAIPEKALQCWARDRLQRADGADGAMVYRFALTGSTCTNVSLNVVMVVRINAQGRIDSATSCPADGDAGWAAMCGSSPDIGRCDEVIGLTLDEAAFRDWHEEPSGCFCSAGNRRHKWRNVFQTLHYAQAHPELDRSNG
jgi:hypothetical protein